MNVVFVHGWSVRTTNTYAGLPGFLEKQRTADGGELRVSHLYLGKYISFDDEVTVDDIACAFENAVNETLDKRAKFACITHSTGGPIVRAWLEQHKRDLSACRMSHLIMLAPANHGSALAQLGKSRLSRMKFFLQGAEPGVRVLHWLELGSDESWRLNESWLDYDCVSAGLFPFVLTGQTIDRQMYDQLNAYTGEPGSDGVVRVAAANLNYGLLRLVQEDGELQKDPRNRLAKPTAFGVLPGQAHSGRKCGIMGSVRADDDGSHPTAHWILRCLRVGNAGDYQELSDELVALTAQTQLSEREDVETKLHLFKRTFITNQYCMLVFRLRDHRSNNLDDYDVILTAGPEYDPNHLPTGFFVDRQRNSRNLGKLTYYLDYTVMEGLNDPRLEGKMGFRIVARPESGLAHYQPLEYRGTLKTLKRFLVPNQTLMIEIELHRRIDQAVFQLTSDLNPGAISAKPSGQYVE